MIRLGNLGVLGVQTVSVASGGGSVSVGSGGGGGGGGGGQSGAAWTIGMTTLGAFAPGGTGQYSITLSNSGTGSSSGLVTLADSLPTGLTANSMSGNGWTCDVGSVSCTNPNTVAAGTSFPTVTLTVAISSNLSGTVTNHATASGGGTQTQGSGSIQTPIGSTGGHINHVVIIFQENRTPDNLFQGLCIPPYGSASACGTGPSQYDLQSYGYVGSQQVTLTPVPLVTTYDINHGHPAFLTACDWSTSQGQCLMDTQNQVPCAPPANCPNNPQYQYVQPTDVQPYLTMAQTYAFGDRMFQTNQGPSYPAHQYILAGTSALCVPGASCPASTGGPTSSTVYVSGNPSDDFRNDGTSGVGCLAPPGSYVNLIDTSQPFPNNNITQLDGSECVERPTLTDLLEHTTPPLSWKYYAAQDGYIWMAPDTIQHICEPTGPQDQLTCGGTDWANHVVIEGSGAQILTDIQNCQMQAVTWIIPDGGASDHAGTNNGSGPSWVSAIVNQIGTSTTCDNNTGYWNDTAIIVLWDDWGGWYDHVPPPIRNSGPNQNSYEYGFRVPIMVISPYAKPAYVSHQFNDFGSILKFIEEVFSLPAVGDSVGAAYADSYALGDLSDFFNFSQTPLVFTPIQAPKGAEYFIHNKAKPSPPDND